MPGERVSEASDRLPGLHALRVAAAVAVYIGHAIFWVAHWSPAFTAIAPTLTLGLQLFFVVSAFSLMHSTRPYEGTPNWVKHFYLKRYWRIAPLFYVMMVVCGLYSFYAADRAPRVLDIILDVFFVNNLVPGYTSSIVYAGWSVSVEMLFYAIFPLVLINVRTINAAAIFTVLMLIVSLVSRVVLSNVPEPTGLGTYADWCVLVQLQFFAFGVLAYLIYDRLKQTSWGRPAPLAETLLRHAAFALPISLIGLFLYAFYDELVAFQHLDQTLCGVAFAILAVWLSLLKIPVLNWGPIQYYGERSYSLYLLHTLVIFLMRDVTNYIYISLHPIIGGWATIPALIVTYIPIMLLASVTYALVERPGMDFGRKLRTQMRDRSPGTPAVSPS